ncbi:hypothetical protein GGI43DRAFT_419411 [Trichoderma evansii]
MTLVKPGQRRRTKAPKVLTAPPIDLLGIAGGWACVYNGWKKELRFVNVSPSLGRSPSRAQLRALQFYVEKTEGQLTTFFPDELWDTIVLQLSHSEPCIQFALSALASYHELFTSATHRPERDPSFRIQQYNAAIKLLLGSAGTLASTTVKLVFVPIFFCIEALRGNHDSAFGLLQCGMQLVGEWRQRECRGDNASPRHHILRAVEGLLSRLTIHTRSFIKGRAIHPSACTFNALPRSAPLSFTSLAEAREFLVIYAAGYLNLERRERLEPQYYIRILREWSAALDSLLQSRKGTDITAAEKRAVSLLKLYERYCVLRLQPKLLLGYLDPAESPAVCSGQVIEELVGLAASALGMEAVEDDARMQPQGKPIFHLEVGVTWILFTLLPRSHDPVIQRKILTPRGSGNAF